MSYSYVDVLFVNRISPFVRNFKKKSDNLWNCSCPICGDSHKTKTKARMYLMRKNNNVNVYCHNCSYTATFANFLKEISYELYKEYLLDKYKNGATKRYHHIPSPYEVMKEESFDIDHTKFDLLFKRLDRIELDNEAREYILNRKIPEEFLSILYYCDNLKKIGDYFPRYKNKIPEDNARLVIPIYNKKREVIGCSARALRESEYRYLNFYENDKDNFIYGLERHNKTQDTFVVEGPLDSLFLPNCLASLNANLIKALEFVDINKTTFIFDNQPRNKEVCKQIRKAIDYKCNVVIWNNEFQFKDINDAILGGFSVEKILAIIRKRTYNSLSAINEFDRWKKVTL